MRLLPVTNLFLLIVALFALLLLVIPPAQTCWIPPNAPTRGFYAECWEAGFLWG